MLRFAAAFALVALTALPANADALYGASFETISTKLGDIAEKPGAEGVSLLIGKSDAIFYTEQQGGATLGTPIFIEPATDIAQAALLLALIDTGFIGLDDPARDYIEIGEEGRISPTTIRSLMTQRAAGGKPGIEAARRLFLIAESATSRAINDVFDERIAAPIALEATYFPKVDGASVSLGGKGPSGYLETNTRDYARLLSIFANGGAVEGRMILSRRMIDFAFMRQAAGAKACREPSADGSCESLEMTGTGHYAWIDRERQIYGLIAANGVSASIAKEASLIREMAETIHDREAKAMGLTSSIGEER